MKKNKLATEETERIAHLVSESLLSQCFIVMFFNDGVEDYEFSGIITKIDQEQRKIKISHNEGSEWIPLDDIINIHLQH